MKFKLLILVVVFVISFSFVVIIIDYWYEMKDISKFDYKDCLLIFNCFVNGFGLLLEGKWG